MPRLNGSSSTSAPAARASAVVASREPSLTTTASHHGAFARTERTTEATVAASLKAGITTRCSFLTRFTLKLPAHRHGSERAKLRLPAGDGGESSLPVGFCGP